MGSMGKIVILFLLHKLVPFMYCTKFIWKGSFPTSRTTGTPKEPSCLSNKHRTLQILKTSCQHNWRMLPSPETQTLVPGSATAVLQVLSRHKRSEKELRRMNLRYICTSQLRWCCLAWTSKMFLLSSCFPPSTHWIPFSKQGEEQVEDREMAKERNQLYIFSTMGQMWGRTHQWKDQSEHFAKKTSASNRRSIRCFPFLRLSSPLTTGVALFVVWKTE